MDRVITVREKKRKQLKRWGLGALIATGVITAYYFGVKTMVARVNINELLVSEVEVGDIESSFNAQGQIIPERELSINAPITTEIQTVFQNIGNKIQKGEKILELNDEFLRLAYETEKDNLLLKKNNIAQSTYKFNMKIRDLKNDSEIYALRLQEQQADLNNLKILDKMGAGTKENVQKKEIALQIAQLKKKKIDDELSFQKKYNQIEKKNLALRVRMNEKDLQKIKTKLGNTTITSPIDGVVMWVNKNIGKQVREGENIARIADLSSFKISATCSDRYANQISLNTNVRFETATANVTGRIVNIEPVVSNNLIKFDVQLDNPKQKNLHAYTKGELRVITRKVKSAKRIRRGIGVKGGKRQDLFVVRGNYAEKVSVRIGASNSTYIEIISNQIKVGDQIIVSDMKAHQHKTKIPLTNE